MTITKLKAKNQNTPEELKAVDQIVEQEKGKAKAVSPGKEFSKYIKKITQ